MKVTKFAAIALLTIGATAITAGSVYAAPAATAPAAIGQQGAVSYSSKVGADGRGVVSTVTAGKFTLASDAKAVTVSDPAGAVIATLPMAFQVAGQKFSLVPTITDAGRTLALAPVGTPAASPAQQATAQHQFVDAAADLARHQYNAGVGALIGLGVGILIGLFFFGVGAIPGSIIGAGIGALIGWSCP
jgi:hypothetical protein